MKRWGSLKSLWHRIFPSVSSKTTWERHHIRVLVHTSHFVKMTSARPRRSMTPGFSSFRVQIFNPFSFVKVKVDNSSLSLLLNTDAALHQPCTSSKLNFAQTSQNNRWGLWNLKVRVISHEQGVPLWWTHVNGASVSWLSPVVLALSRACAPLCISRPKSVSKLNWNSPKFWDNSKLSAMLTLPMFTPCGWRTRATIYNKTQMEVEGTYSEWPSTSGKKIPK